MGSMPDSAMVTLIIHLTIIGIMTGGGHHITTTLIIIVLIIVITHTILTIIHHIIHHTILEGTIRILEADFIPPRQVQDQADKAEYMLLATTEDLHQPD